MFQRNYYPLPLTRGPVQPACFTMPWTESYTMPGFLLGVFKKKKLKRGRRMKNAVGVGTPEKLEAESAFITP